MVHSLLKFALAPFLRFLWRFSSCRVLFALLSHRGWGAEVLGLYSPLWARVRILALRDGDYDLARVAAYQERYYAELDELLSGL